jgi:adenosylcobinamide kinase/adenosylcobinamide-phosphate guanylyltransferase
MASLSSPHHGSAAVSLVLGGARSGKSRFAEGLIETAAMHGTYCATAEPGDAEMAARIAAHRARRQEVRGGDFWRTVEAPLDLSAAITRDTAPGRPLLIDCLTLWLSNLLLADKSIETETRLLCAALGEAAGPVVLVANEVGLGLVPETPLAHCLSAIPGVSADHGGFGDPRLLPRRGSALDFKDKTCMKEGAACPPRFPPPSSPDFSVPERPA